MNNLFISKKLHFLLDILNFWSVQKQNLFKITNDAYILFADILLEESASVYTGTRYNRVTWFLAT